MSVDIPRLLLLPLYDWPADWLDEWMNGQLSGLLAHVCFVLCHYTALLAVTLLIHFHCFPSLIFTVYASVSSPKLIYGLLYILT